MELKKVLTECQPNQVAGHKELEKKQMDEYLSTYLNMVDKLEMAVEETVVVLARLEELSEGEDEDPHTGGRRHIEVQEHLQTGTS